MYNSKHDTINHIEKVMGFLEKVVINLETRASKHDESKLEEPEKSMYDEYTPLLKDLTYGSYEYTEILKKMGNALQHHYQENTHHPEHWQKGVNGMSLLDVIEMLCDWKAASLRHSDGNIMESLKINRKRFEISDQLAEILENTVEEMGW